MQQAAKKSMVSLIVALVVCLAAFDASAAVRYSNPLEKRSRVELKFGLWNLNSQSKSEIGANGVQTTATSDGPLGQLTYAYWVRENLAVTFSVGVLAGEYESSAGSGGVSTHVLSVLPILIGVRHYLPESALATSWKPYLAASIGSFIGAVSRSETGTQVITDSRTEAAYGGYLGGGLDIQLSRYFMVGANLGYNLMTDFSESLGGRKNYSGPEFGLGISFLFGRGVNP